MKDMNKVFLLGRLGIEPELRTTRTGISVAKLSLATARRIREEGADPGSRDAWRDETQWHRVVAWGKLAESVQRVARKGMTVLVEGTIRSRKYEDREGKPQYSFEVHADEISFLGGPRSILEKSDSAAGEQGGELVEEVAVADDLPY